MLVSGTPDSPHGAGERVTQLVFDGRSVAFICRAKTSLAQSPDLMDQHGDCILENGAPIGFFGEDFNPMVDIGRVVGESALMSIVPGVGPVLGFALGFGDTYTRRKGLVRTYHDFRTARPEYVSISEAKAKRQFSAIATVPVSVQEVQDFRSSWQAMRLNPDAFHYLFNNCSTHAAKAFARANIIKPTSETIETPDHLFRYLMKTRSGAKDYYGYVGFTPAGGGGSDIDLPFAVEVAPA